MTTPTLLSLPWLIKWHVYTHLPSRDCIALSATCRDMYGFNMFAYTHLQFLPPNNLLSLARALSLLAELLASSPLYAQAVRTVRIVGCTTTDVPEGCNHEAVYRALDERIMVLLGNAPHIYSFTLDLNLTRAIHYFPRTLTTLARVRTIRDLRLATFLAAGSLAESNHLLEYVPEEKPPEYQRMYLSLCTGGWLPVVVRDPRNLRWFGLSVLDKAWAPGDTSWAMALHRIAAAATELETLVLYNGSRFDANALGRIFQFGLERGALGKLRSFSLSTIALSLSGLRQLFGSFSRSSVTHLRIVVNHHGRWLHDFGPQYLSELYRLIPDLEEISLDQMGMFKPAPLPGHLGAWGEAFRMFKKLRRIVLASMFVLDLCRPRAAIDDADEEEEEEEEAEGNEDSGMDVDEGDEGYETEDGEMDGTHQGLEDSLEPNLVHLAAWADMFLDDHLRKVAPFSEIWFLDPRFPGRTAAGFNQRIAEGEGEGGRAEHMIYYPILKRKGWWWDEYEPIALD
ncbi:hypothetical protein BC827DRAFT_880535 [Russula dissimulans]|nr:hypothetical protein BC827DRAFT_880535 [Russula dissimulans]